MPASFGDFNLWSSQEKETGVEGGVSKERWRGRGRCAQKEGEARHGREKGCGVRHPSSAFCVVWNENSTPSRSSQVLKAFWFVPGTQLNSIWRSSGDPEFLRDQWNCPKQPEKSQLHMGLNYIPPPKKKIFFLFFPQMKTYHAGRLPRESVWPLLEGKMILGEWTFGSDLSGLMVEHSYSEAVYLWVPDAGVINTEKAITFRPSLGISLGHLANHCGNQSNELEGFVLIL